MNETVFLKIPLFSNLSQDELTQLVHELPVEDYASGSYLFREGDSGESLYVVIEGKLEVLLA
ncbi:MAG TPA: cyclic nucleotide-binding domain-containing protein, partial [Anaerolineales bacterium]|nr:cyclic nucleotide-binding domain-containing protein [Anaerolineales bacterium]